MQFSSSFLVFSFLFCSCLLHSQMESFVFENEIYKPNISSVKFNLTGNMHSYPLLELGSNMTLSLSFDDLDGDFKNYFYSIIHCDKNWKPSDIDELDYVEGFNEVDIIDFGSSIQARQNYTHYRFRFPNEDIRPVISGNYLLVIFEDEEEVEPVITRRFMVSEKWAQITATSVKPANVEKLNTHQELSVQIDLNNKYISDPVDELELCILQNGRWDNAIMGAKADYVTNSQLFFKRYDQFAFPALKEFRFFDIRTLDFARQNVLDFEYDGNLIYALLEKDYQRYNRVFMSENDLNGDFIIQNQDRNDANLKSEYVHMIFSLEANFPFSDKEVYLIGAFSDWKARSIYKMEYNEEKRMYLGEAVFKQGYYNYMYALVDPETGLTDIEAIEGDWYETENEYLILCYFSEFGSRYDRLAGFSTMRVNAP